MLMNSTRREWIFCSMGSVAFAAMAAAHEHAAQSVKAGTHVPLEFFSATEAADVAAIASQIVPSDDGPGANEAGVIYFIDRALTTFDVDRQDIYRKGMPGIRGVAARSKDKQFLLVRSIENSQFFEIVRAHTVLGFLGSPAYGGNRNEVGWKYIQFENRMAWEPPFGYYDAVTK
jgi:gluconate 2-dehydrogenase gamma chain